VDVSSDDAPSTNSAHPEPAVSLQVSRWADAARSRPPMHRAFGSCWWSRVQANLVEAHAAGGETRPLCSPSAERSRALGWVIRAQFYTN